MLTSEERARGAYFWSTLCTWFAEYGRDLPWRHAPTAYEVWVSELMLQQTQVATVIPYYLHWMQRFPDLNALARSQIEDVLALWSGLGYYRRARYLHAGAQYLAAHCGGVFPKTLEELQKIPGVGAYTAGAIAAFAFGQSVPAIDGNAERVFSRYFGISGDLTRGAARARLWELASFIADMGHSRELNQAVMDLGASFCSRTAECASCPLQSQCFARQFDKTKELPNKTKRTKKSGEFCVAIRLFDGDGRELWARRRADGLLGGLWQYPTIRLAHLEEDGNGEIRQEAEKLARSDRRELWTSWCASLGHLALKSWAGTGIRIEHIFSHIRMLVEIDTGLCEHPDDIMHFMQDSGEFDAYQWLSPQSLDSNFATSGLMQKMQRAFIEPGEKPRRRKT